MAGCCAPAVARPSVGAGPAKRVMTSRRVTLADVARAAGVHTTTVSLALRNHPRLPPATRERLQTLAKKMHYTPDPWVRALVAYRGALRKRRNPAVIAYVTNWNTRLGWKRVTAHPEFFAGAEARASELGYQLEHFWLREPGLTSARLGGILKARGVTGVIIASHVRERDVALRLDWSQFSAVKIDYFPHEDPLSVVANNHFQIMRLAMQHVRERGYRRVGFVMDDGWDITVDRLWSAGFLWGQQDLAPEDRLPPCLLPQDGPVEAWLQRYRPEVVISKGEFVLPVLSSLRVQVPRELAFVDLFLENEDGRTAGVRQNHAAVGALAVDILASRMQHNERGSPSIPTTTYVDGTWFDGRSLPACSGSSPGKAAKAIGR